MNTFEAVFVLKVWCGHRYCDYSNSSMLSVQLGTGNATHTLTTAMCKQRVKHLCICGHKGDIQIRYHYQYYYYYMCNMCLLCLVIDVKASVHKSTQSERRPQDSHPTCLRDDEQYMRPARKLPPISRTHKTTSQWYVSTHSVCCKLKHVFIEFLTDIVH